MTRILVAEPWGYSREALEILESAGDVIARPLSRAELLHEVPECDALIVRLGFQIDDEVFAAARRLTVVGSPTTGLDHVDLRAAEARGVTVVSLRGERTFLERIPATAEHTWALLLALVRRVPLAAASVVDGVWDRDSFRGTELSGKTLGIVGLGRVGKQVARIGHGFGMAVAAYDPLVPDRTEDVAISRTLQELLATSDVVTLHVPLDESTSALIGEQELSMMRGGAVLVNTSRGEVIDERALLEALEQRTIAGAALDVVADERSPTRAKALIEYAATHDNLLITPHIGGATVESMARTEVFIARRVVEHLGQRT